jgi:hypothetical protein
MYIETVFVKEVIAVLEELVVDDTVGPPAVLLQVVPTRWNHTLTSFPGRKNPSLLGAVIFTWHACEVRALQEPVWIWICDRYTVLEL